MLKSHFIAQRMQCFQRLVMQPPKLIKSKCLPVLLYSLEACPFTKSDLQSLDFVISRFFMKLFTTKSIKTVKYCQEYFDFSLPSVLFINFISPNVVASAKQKYAERTDRGRQLQRVPRKQTNMQTRQLQLKKNPQWSDLPRRYGPSEYLYLKSASTFFVCAVIIVTVYYCLPCLCSE